MTDKEAVKLFENKSIRVSWDKDNEEWLFSVVDAVGILTESSNTNDARNYWKVLKHRLIQEGAQLVTICNQLKLLAKDGKRRLTDVATTEQLFRIIQSIPSKKAEPFKLWLAQTGRERIEEEYDPERAINRALETYRRKGYSDDWINQRLKSIDVRKEFTDELKNTGVTRQKDFAILTNILTQVWSGYTVREYKDFKGLTKESLRDNMTNMELVLNMLAETSSTEISKQSEREGYDGAEKSVKQGGSVAKNAREQIEGITGKKIVSKNRHINQPPRSPLPPNFPPNVIIEEDGNS